MHEVQGFFCKTVVLWINSKLQNWEKTWYGPHLTSPIEVKARGAAHPGPWAGRWSRRAGRGAGSNEEARSGQRSEQRRGTSRWLTRSTRAPTPVDVEGSSGAAAGNRGNGGGLALDSARASRGEIRRGDLAERGRTGTGRIRGQGGGLGRRTEHSFVSHERERRQQKCRGSRGAAAAGLGGAGGRGGMDLSGSWRCRGLGRCVDSSASSGRCIGKPREREM